MAKKCIYCGCELEDEAKFCDECGKKQDEAERKRIEEEEARKEQERIEREREAENLRIKAEAEAHVRLEFEEKARKEKEEKEERERKEREEKEAAEREKRRLEQEEERRKENELRIKAEAEAKANAELQMLEHRRERELEEQRKREDAEMRYRIEAEMNARINAEKEDERSARQIKSMALKAQLEPSEKVAIDSLKNSLMSTKSQKKRKKILSEFQMEIHSDSQLERLRNIQERVGRKEPTYIAVNRVIGWILISTLILFIVLSFFPSSDPVIAIYVLLAVLFWITLPTWIIMKIIQVVARTRADNYLNIKDI